VACRTVILIFDINQEGCGQLNKDFHEGLFW